MIENSNNY